MPRRRAKPVDRLARAIDLLDGTLADLSTRKREPSRVDVIDALLDLRRQLTVLHEVAHLETLYRARRRLF